ncbi:putative F-box domain-containing protein [Helianthus annuus]|uniref:F-box domain-containing protein n=1 Tax=Helianthus annuus TaxID=4232 RepID=A0A251TXH4_HELAN|nr:F-box/kelch-repeat protein At3g23880 [Helianthus annuus]KAF5791908.1 putative F-box domain-containing protein [Helianthus annuus]KAJ0526914.1 putative F-box domain-containing protein [Helianthus annuus]KAJ0535477.1 putative F-box domain-containing protein [Helianthus annuus]KAJ0543310.1 putative F-box domain-containing protein [Helianthus annuus]KAJ0708367.1 putative F-box domain-containing protein [Helianthus annuus]
MAKFVHADVVEQILLRSEVKDLIRFKSVCKSWHSLITSPRFVNRHLKHSYNKDRNDSKIGHRRITFADDDHRPRNLVGSSNGLVCVESAYLHFSVVNPLTGEVTQLRRSPYICLWLFWGFGYDESTDDYKVIVKGENRTCVRVMSLKSNVWRVIEDVKYEFISKTGILSHGALHWIVRDQNCKKLIISFDLSKEEFKEIPQPADAGYECTYSSRLGIVKECLCIFRRSNCCLLDNLWIMKSYNVKGSWERLPHIHNMQHDIVHHLKGNVSWPSSTLEHHWGCECGWKNTAAPIFVQSLVSPHVNGRPASAINLLRNSRVGSVDAPPL